MKTMSNFLSWGIEEKHVESQYWNFLEHKGVPSACNIYDFINFVITLFDRIGKDECSVFGDYIYVDGEYEAVVFILENQTLYKCNVKRSDFQCRYGENDKTNIVKVEYGDTIRHLNMYGWNIIKRLIYDVELTSADLNKDFKYEN